MGREATRDVVERAVGAACGVGVSRMARVSGGDVAEAFRCELSDGNVVFAKTHAAPPPDFFDTEARGLRALRATGCRVPDVLAVSADALILEWVEERRGASGSDAVERELGRMLAAAHRTPIDTFGRDDHRTTGSRRLPNEPCATWPEFFASQRLLPLARLGADEGALAPNTIADLEAVASRLDQLDIADDGPAQLHGDLWAGNRIIDATGLNWLIDPAAHGGHREFDLAMMLLFGGFGGATFAAYDEAFPLRQGWEQRVPLHQLAPLAVHAIKFGGGYAAATQRALDACRSLLA